MGGKQEFGSRLRGWRKLDAMRRLASGESQQTVADAHEVTQQTVSTFAQTNRAAIAEIAADLDSEFAGLWIADKRRRIAEYEQMTDEVGEAIATVRSSSSIRTDDGELVAVDDEALARLVNVRAKLLRTAGEELGQMPARANLHIDAPNLTVKLVGVDLDKL